MNDSKISKVLKYTVYFLGGFLSALPYIGGSFSPFAASFAASCGELYSVSAAAGSILSIFLFHSGLTSFRYFAITITSTATLHIALRAFLMKKENLLRILCPTVCSFTVNFIFLLSQGKSTDLIISIVCETALCGASVPVFTEAIKQIKNRKFLQRTDENEKKFICFVLTIIFAAAHLRALGIAGQAVSCFVFFLSILIFSQIKGFFGGVTTGICCAFVYAMSGDVDFTCVMFALCGCLCSFIEFKYKFEKALIVSACGAAGFLFGEYTEFLPILPAAVSAGIAYCIIPIDRLELTENFDEKNEKIRTADNEKSNEIASAVESLSDCVNAVRKTLQPLMMPELKTELIRTKERVCAQCEICDSCINEIKNSDNPCFKKIAKSFETGEPNFSLFPENFSETCCHSETILEEMKKAYFIHCTNVNAGNKINRFQTLAGNQFKTFGGIIGQACEAATGVAVKESRYDSVCATSAEEFGVKIKDARLCTDKAGRDYFDISFVKPENNFSVTALTEKLNTDTGYELDFPTLIQNGNVYDLVFKQKEQLSFNIAAAVKAGEGKNVCGDYYRCFKDSFSRQVVLLSDGMGTGSRAAVDSAFTCETFSTLIKSGLDEKTAAAAVNCAMMMKSTDESFSTVDFLRLDPVLKTAQVFKCGAAPTFILKKRKTSVIETESTPIGILDNVNMSESSFDIDKGDIIILASDGVSGDKFNWIFSELKSWNNLNASALAKHILQCAADRKIGKRTDDMTVIAVCVAEKN
ncbi:MAG: SpoIIE family protein phosphatase [Clostridia bacterium]|nr:SpoIIE family protein phosphatase [Clostridia bacterium]